MQDLCFEMIQSLGTLSFALSLSLALAGSRLQCLFVLFCFLQCFFFLVAVGAMPEGHCFCRRRTKDKKESSETCQSTTSSTDAPFLSPSLSASLPRSLAPLPQPCPPPPPVVFFGVQICEVGGVGDHSQEDLAKFG